MTSVMIARLGPNTTFDPAFRRLDSSLSQLSLSGLGAREEMYTGGASSSADYEHLFQQGVQQQQQPQQRPELGRRMTYTSSSNMCVFDLFHLYDWAVMLMCCQVSTTTTTTTTSTTANFDRTGLKPQAILYHARSRANFPSTKPRMANFKS